VHQFKYPPRILGEGEWMRNRLQIPAYLFCGVLGHVLGRGTDFYAFSVTGGLILGIVVAGLIGDRIDTEAPPG